jgi:hypothetical protein
MSVQCKIMDAIKVIAEEQKVILPQLDDDLSLNETGLESRGFSILIARPVDDLGIDRFTIWEPAPALLTVGDLVRSYENDYA